MPVLENNPHFAVGGRSSHELAENETFWKKALIAALHDAGIATATDRADHALNEWRVRFPFVPTIRK